jgi:formylmethanofuran dehydrogenase subunit E
MDDLISRQDAIDAVAFDITYAKAFDKETGEVKELFAEGNYELKKAIDRIKELPSVDTVEVRRGRWEVIFYDNIPKIAKCSECGEALFFTKEDYPIRHISNYCPNCGAKMDAERRADATFN